MTKYSVHNCENTFLTELCQDQEYMQNPYFLTNSVILPNYFYVDSFSTAAEVSNQALFIHGFFVDCFKDDHELKQGCFQ